MLTHEQINEAAKIAVPNNVRQPGLSSRMRNGWIEGVKSETARIHHQQEWIPAIERLPEERGRYLCWVETINDLGKESYVWNCYYGGQEYLFADNGIKYNVTHWQPLPPAPTI